MAVEQAARHISMGRRLLAVARPQRTVPSTPFKHDIYEFRMNGYGPGGVRYSFGARDDRRSEYYYTKLL